IIARWNISDGYYLYRQKFSFRIVEGPSGLTLGTPELPKGKVKQDEFFGQIEAYYGDTTVRIPILYNNVSTNASTVAGKKLVVKFDYQGCAEAGICYPPISKNIAFQLSGKPSPGTGNQSSQAATKTTEQAVTTPETTNKNSSIDNRKKLLALLAAFGFGLLLTFTPCVLPMIPILSSIIIGQGGEKITKLRGGMLSLTYVLGTSVTYTSAGIMAGKTGEQLQAYFQNAWAIGTLSAILVFMAISMFGLFELQMPSFIQSKLQSRNQQGGKFAGVFIMGIISSLIVGACVSPLLITALGLAIKTGDPVLGGGIMFAMSMGMGVVLVAIGIGAGTILPKAGDWMENVKHVFGVLLLAVAIYLLGVLPEVPVLLLWSALLIVTAIYLGATEGIPAGSSGWRYFWKGTGIVMLLWGVLALLGGMAGNRDILNPLPLNLIGSSNIAVASVPGQQTPAHTELFETVTTLEQITARMDEAKAQNKPLLIDFFATWCTDCLRMEKSTFMDPRISALLGSEFTTLQVDVTDPNDPDGRAIKTHFGVYGPPAMLFFSA
ncbi:MAG: protein-disulfide reductase DsbD, partial [Gammaproteobacteria bacterium]|nr:protein-disulfide reductase DsbD [Gammaproteobacteria bacterium]